MTGLKNVNHKETHNRWTEAEEARLIQLVKDGLTNKQILEQLNLSRPENQQRTWRSIATKVKILRDAKLIDGIRRPKTSKYQAYYANPLQGIENFKNRISKTRHRLADATLNISDENHKFIVEIDLRNEADGLSPTTRDHYMRYLKALAQELKQKSLIDVKLESDILPYINKLQLRLKGINEPRAALKFFYNEMAEKYPNKKELMRIASYFNKKRRGRNNRKEVKDKPSLTKREIVKLVSGIKGNDKMAIRDRAMIAALYDSGTRLAELTTISKKNCYIDDKVPRFHAEMSKTMPRDTNMLNFSLPYLMEWIKVHEFWDREDAPLFYSFSTSNFGEPIAQNMVGLIVRRAARIAGLKNVSPHVLRHSKAFHCAADGMLPAEANDRFGWGRSSSMFIYYTKISEKEMQLRELERANKLTPEQIEERKIERNAFVLKNCARCGAEATPDQFVCGRCGLALNKQVADKELVKEKELTEMKEQLEAWKINTRKELMEEALEMLKREVIQK